MKESGDYLTFESSMGQAKTKRMTWVEGLEYYRHALAQACGGGKCKGRVSPTRRARVLSRDFSQKNYGDTLRAPEAGRLSVLSTCVTKQTKDMRYSEGKP